MVERIQPKLLAEIGRLERSSSLRRIFNFDGIRQNVAGPLSTDKEPVKARGVVASARMLLWAGYIEWFRRDNN
jgi:hypothetical protein